MSTSPNYYTEERKLYAQAYETKISDDMAIKIVRKLCNHYKIMIPELYFRGHEIVVVLIVINFVFLIILF